MKIVLRNTLVDYHLTCRWSSGLLDESLCFLMPRKAINQHTRLQIGAEIFGSVISSQQEKNVTIFAKWKAVSDESINVYLGEVQYYFEHTLRFPEGSKTHFLVYIKWYKCASTSGVRFKHSFMELEISNTELWKTEYYEEGCDSLLAVHRILCRATKFKYITIGKHNYLSIIPLNRKFNL
ncbi:hypothetical protein GLOIN_2v1775288 [Rhizophagus clarus]|nr:hypothetical protein GLOIN_2v1775288 [Rhizophagus clarus]